MRNRDGLRIEDPVEPVTDVFDGELRRGGLEGEVADHAELECRDVIDRVVPSEKQDGSDCGRSLVPVREWMVAHNGMKERCCFVEVGGKQLSPERARGRSATRAKKAVGVLAWSTAARL